jgi:peroxiredoxin
MNKMQVMLLVIMLGMVLGSCRKHEEQPAVEASAEIGSIAPDFVLNDLSGKTTKLSSYKGTVVLLEFWATWCPPCKDAIPDMEKLYHKYHGQGFTILGISMDADSEAAKVAQFAVSHGISYPVLIADDAVLSAYSVMSIPALFIIGRDGTITASYAGYFENFLPQVSAAIEKNL